MGRRLQGSAWVMAGLCLWSCSAAGGGADRRAQPGSEPNKPAAPLGDGDGSDFGNSDGPAVSPPTGDGDDPSPAMPGPTPVTVQPGEMAAFDDCPGGLSDSDLQALTAGGATDASMRFLYPYDGTVFPRGLPAPLLQWSPAAAGSQAVLVRATSTKLDYRGCFGDTPLAQVQLPQEVWDAAFVVNQGAGDPVHIEITTLSGGVVSGPIAIEVVLARATLKGAIYYNTYSSLKAASQGVLNGVVMRVEPGQLEPEVFVTAQTPSIAGDVCVGCHSVSADGTRMVVEEHSGLGIAYNTSLSYSLGANQAPRPPVQSQLGNSKAAFSALYPDGSRFLTTGRPEVGPFSSGMSVSGTFGVEPAALWDANTGEQIPDTGIPAYAKMPMFNGKGTKVVFTDQDAGDALAVMDFDPTSNKFSGHRVVADDPRFIGWPFFLPDDSGVVFALTDQPGYTTMAGADLTGLLPNNGHLKMVDLASGAVIPLARAMGYRDQAMADPYVPAGVRDLDKDYIPTVSPVAAGGYFWLFFTSKRTYGNVKAGPAPTADSKQIWVSALSIPGSDPAFDSSQGLDPSHPPFRLPGQELESGNIRAFATLNPCKADGDSCETGIDCCSGFCTDGVCGKPPEPRCSEIDEACDTSADCCDVDIGVECIAGFCAFLQVVK